MAKKLEQVLDLIIPVEIASQIGSSNSIIKKRETMSESEFSKYLHSIGGFFRNEVLILD